MPAFAGMTKKIKDQRSKSKDQRLSVYIEEGWNDKENQNSKIRDQRLSVYIEGAELAGSLSCHP
jgi:hypothetical protein